MEPGWHKKDNGPVLTSWRESGTPVACVPGGPEKYYLYDPLNSTRIPLTQKIADQLSNEAYMFYRPFPERKMS